MLEKNIQSDWSAMLTGNTFSSFQHSKDKAMHFHLNLQSYKCRALALLRYSKDPPIMA